MPFSLRRVLNASRSSVRKAMRPCCTGLTTLLVRKADIHVFFGDVHLYRAVGDEGDIARIALVPDTVATHVGNRPHVEDVAIEFIHRRDVCGGEINVMQLELHDVAFRNVATSWRAEPIRYCKSEPAITKRAPSFTSSATCSTSARIPPMPRCLPCVLQAFAVRSYAARNFGFFSSPGMPMAVQRSLEPISNTSMPGVAAIASALAMPSGVSNIATRTVVALPSLLTSLSGVAR